MGSSARDAVVMETWAAAATSERIGGRCGVDAGGTRWLPAGAVRFACAMRVNLIHDETG